MRRFAAALAVSLTLACRPAPTSESTNQHGARQEVEMRYLEPNEPALAAEISPADLGQHSKFVIVEIARVENPRRVALQFRVSFEPREGADVVLGTFSLYPSNNPGRFIVATQGKVQSGGRILLSIMGQDKELRDVRVGVAKLTLGAE